MKISFNQACTLHNSNLEMDLELCEKAGYDAIELRIDKIREYLLSHSLDELVEFFRTHCIKPYSINGIYVYTDFMSQRDDLEKQQALLRDIEYACKIGSAIGCNKMVMVPPVFFEEECRTYDDPWEKILEDNVRIFSAMSDFVRSYGMLIGIEIVGAARISVRTIKQCNEILDRVGKDNVGYTIDSYNLYLYHKTNNFDSILDAYLDRIFIVHINGGADCPEDEYLQKNRTFADRGVMDVQDFVGKLDQLGYKELVSIEFFCPDCWARPAWDVIEECYTTTKAVLDKTGLFG